ncbi:fasciclin-like arabinogalactan protein 4 isoform X2 [Vigna angularis]|uniref:fasciclin-like arabinogalactan protein 4 isoform X2 n=1 Tax=Phaseolus angularis TaxID=3914 RepID=UPI00080A0DC2|nr:fasciclin-like arabinogalactan protein 4 isoform X2 [Vigna angularis]XP_052732733.1 fasciclin-like arabinogalactan protein 4 isoform X2 [Vigna angularis]
MQFACSHTHNLTSLSHLNSIQLNTTQNRTQQTKQPLTNTADHRPILNPATLLNTMRSRSHHGISITQNALALLYLFCILTNPPASTALNFTALLSTVPDLSQFTALLASATPITADLSDRSSLSILAVPNAFLAADDHLARHHLSPAALADVLRYHVLLQFLSWSDLRALPSSGKLVTTLLQTTGRATDNFGSVNLTRDPQSGLVSIRSPAPYSPSNVTVLSLVKTLPYNVTIFAVNSLLIPYGLDLMASETRPNIVLNITKALIDGHNFNVAASMLAASGVVQEFEADEGGAGITLFVPVDDAFADLPPSVALQSLPADKKGVVLKFHVLHSYYPLGSLESVVNPFQPTLATEAMGAGSFTLNISRVNGSVAINTGIVQASVTQTVFDQNPVAIFGVSKVLLPREIFGRNPTVTAKPIEGAPPPDEDALSPENSPGLDGQPSHLSSPPGFREDVRSHGGGVCGGCFLLLSYT